MSVPLFHVDAFTEHPFAGNPAAVCLLPSWQSDRWLQAVAGEMNLSETAFLVRQSGHFDLRWFTPKVEVDLCGHATLASAHVLWQAGQATGDGISFSTKSGALRSIRRGEFIELDFPLKAEMPVQPPPGLLESLGVSAMYVGKNQFDFLVEVESEDVLRRMAPDFKRLASVQARGIIVTCKAVDRQFDFVSRFFAPAAGVNEDPVTGSAHCCLADYWRKRLGQTEFTAFQASARGGVVKMRIVDDRVLLAGRAITVAKGELVVDGEAG
jgi:predicted PhzF superfamily epimerase YddE/YHI9